MLITLFNIVFQKLDKTIRSRDFNPTRMIHQRLSGGELPHDCVVDGSLADPVTALWTALLIRGALAVPCA